MNPYWAVYANAVRTEHPSINRRGLRQHLRDGAPREVRRVIFGLWRRAPEWGLDA